MKKIEEYKLVIWDLDGTLYYQKEFRKKMMKVILKELVLDPIRWQEAGAILRYRRIREGWDPSDTAADLEKRQYMACGEECGLSGYRVQKIIEYWMHEKPLNYLKTYRDEQAAELIQKLKQKGILNVVYSDYPTADKLAALDIEIEKDRQFCSADPQIGCMKPNPKGILHILDVFGVEAKDTLMIGDRMEKDGEAARAAGVDCLILDTKREKRKLCYSIHCNS